MKYAHANHAHVTKSTFSLARAPVWKTERRQGAIERASRVCEEDSGKIVLKRKKRRETEDSEEHGGEVVFIAHDGNPNILQLHKEEFSELDIYFTVSKERLP